MTRWFADDSWKGIVCCATLIYFNSGIHLFLLLLVNLQVYQRKRRYCTQGARMKPLITPPQMQKVRLGIT